MGIFHLGNQIQGGKSKETQIYLIYFYFNCWQIKLTVKFDIVTQNNSLPGVPRGGLSQSRTKFAFPTVVAAAVSSNGRPGENGNVSVLVENNPKKETKDASSPVVEKETKSKVSGGVGDVYGEDTASEDQSITPWTVSVAR